MSVLGYFIRLHARRWRWLAGGLLLMLLAVLSGIGLLALSGWFVTATGLTGLLMAAGASVSLDIYRPGAGIRAFAVGRAVFRYGERLLNHEAVLRTLADLRLWVVNGLLPKRRQDLAQLRDGELLNRITTDVDTLDQLFLRLLAPSIVAALGLLAAGLLMAIWAPLTGFLIVVLLLAGSLCCIGWLIWRGHRPGTELAAAQSHFRQQLIASLNAMTELRFFDSDGRYGTALLDTGRHTARLRLQLGQQTALGDSLLTVLSQLAVWLTALFGIALYGDGAISGPILVMLVLTVFALGEILRPLPTAWQQLGRLQWSAVRLFGLRQSDSGPVPDESGSDAPAEQPLRMEQVSFRYRDGQPLCLDAVSLSLHPGDRLAIVGPSGTGKSALLDLLMGELEPLNGRVMLGDTMVNAIPPTRRARQLALLEQRTVLFQGSIADNLLLARPDASDAMLWDVLELVELAEFIDGMPDGLDSQLGPGGGGLSGGQARRLAWARTLLAPGNLLLLDEPTEGLPMDQGRRILERLSASESQRVIVMVSHASAVIPDTFRRLQLIDGHLQPRGDGR
ncbi:thiol reductant ABC exporter subunit CydC [Methylonatrum kenyense]|uniref:thiol reductant ABC exporter subunit CydC n=1 Tax=Methylonatrum kenyense TaxID=455253 RepID=UPI0020BDA79B|nr:thiol reductant ABC exporter subunit CydC [Methylonatrum kenyense]MCK8515749.1 thiol reductant ABC exporter subunit CydC [Methylonatrum kenyense]